MSKVISHLVNWLFVPDGIILREDLRNIIEAIADSNVFNDVTRVKDVGSCWRYFEFKCISLVTLEYKTHLLSTFFTELVMVGSK